MNWIEGQGIQVYAQQEVQLLQRQRAMRMYESTA